MKTLAALIFVTLLVYVQASGAQIYKKIDENGKVHFSDQPFPKEHEATDAKLKNTSSVDSLRQSRVAETVSKRVFIYSDSLTFKIRELLRKKKFIELNKLLRTFHLDASRDIESESQLFLAYRAFDISSPAYEALLTEWVEATPMDYQPYLARAEYFYRFGWFYRGNKWKSETLQFQVDVMDSYFNRAKQDAAKGVDLNRQALNGYYILAAISHIQSREEEARKYVDQAIKINPATYYVRAMHMRLSTPSWGGSFEVMRAFSEESLQYVDRNSKLEWLVGLVYSEVARSRRTSGQYTVAGGLYDKALEHGENPRTLVDRGMNYYFQKIYKLAADDFTQAIKIDPEDSEPYRWRANAYIQLNEIDKALADVEFARQLKPHNKEIAKLAKTVASYVRKQAFDLAEKMQLVDAVDKYNAAIRLDPSDASAYYWKAKALTSQYQYTEAIHSLQKSIDRDPDHYYSYLQIDYILSKSRQWGDIARFWEKYIDRNPEDSRAYLEVSGTYYHKGDMKLAALNAKKAADLGNPEAKSFYDKLSKKVQGN